MKIVKPAKIPVLTRIVEFGRRPYFHVAGIIAFPLDKPRALYDELTFWQTASTALGQKGIFDEGPAKPRGELLVCGNFFAPEGKPLPASYVRVRMGSIDKRLAVLGERFWQDGIPSAPIPMTTMPVDWTRAFGGPRCDRNPYGKGFEPLEVDGRMVHALPNIEPFGALMRSPAERPEPACLLPMDVTFSQRRARAGTYDQRWLDEHFPGMPPDMQPEFFNVASPDQWLDGFFHGDEEFLIENMHPDKPRIEGRLPGLGLRFFVTHKTPEGQRFLEIPLRCDLVWLFPTAGMGAVVFHGSMLIAEDDAADIVHLLCACEEPTSPRSIEHYQATLHRRVDKDKGALAGLSDSDLMPARDSGVSPNLGDSDLGRWSRNENRMGKNMRRGQERRHAEARARIEAEGLDPKQYGLADLEPEPAPPPIDDLDAMAAYMEAQMVQAEDLQRQCEAKEKEAVEKAKASFAEMGENYDEVMAKGAKDNAGPPKFSSAKQFAELEEMAREARENGSPLPDLEKQLANPTYRAQVEEQEKNLLEMYRMSAHMNSTAAPAMDSETAEQTRLLVQMCLESGESLAHRNFTGAQLAGMNLAGVDLSGALLESADLRGCDLSRAILSGAVLARANLCDADLSGALLTGTNLGRAQLENTNLERADLKDAILQNATFKHTRLTDAEIPASHWMDVELAGVDFSGANLSKALFVKLDMKSTAFVGANLDEATFVECRLDAADFNGASMHKTSFVTCAGETTSFREGRMRQAVFVHGSSFPASDFSDANLEKANFRGTVLRNARFDHANLDGADLSECDAAGASFERAMIKAGMLIRTNLRDASLQGANMMDALASKSRLAGTNFTGANLYRADLSRVIGDGNTTFSEAEVGHVRLLPKADVPMRGRS